MNGSGNSLANSDDHDLHAIFSAFQIWILRSHSGTSSHVFDQPLIQFGLAGGWYSRALGSHVTRPSRATLSPFRDSSLNRSRNRSGVHPSCSAIAASPATMSPGIGSDWQVNRNSHSMRPSSLHARNL